MGRFCWLWLEWGTVAYSSFQWVPMPRLPDALLSKSNHTYLQYNDHSWDSEYWPFDMAFGTRYCGAQGLLLLTWCLWLMVWHDHTENLGLKGGCRPVQPSSQTPSSGLCLLIWQRSSCLRNQAGTALDHTKERQFAEHLSVSTALLWAAGAKPCCSKGTSGGRQDAVWRQTSEAAGSCSKRSHSI